MVAVKRGKTRFSARHALAGLEAGVLGSLLMLGWLMLGSIWLRRSIWTIPNLMATSMYGPGAYSNRYGRSSLAGAALIIVLYGLLGALWGAFWKDRQAPFLRVAGAITGLVVYAVLFGFVWKHARPLISLYAPDRQMEMGHLLWGLVLARSPRFSRTMAGLEDEASPPELPLKKALQEPEISSGEATL